MNNTLTRRGNGRFIVFYIALFFAGMLTEIVASGGNIPHVLNGGLYDPDSFMRLVRIEQGLKLGHLVNVVHRDDSGVPLVIEWSRLFDALIVGLAAPMAPWIGWHRALFVAGVATGPLSAGLLGAGLAFAVAPLSDRGWLWTAPIIGLLLPGIRGYAAFGIIHYHIMQIAFVAITAGFALRVGGGVRGSAWLAGVFGGLSIWIMPETMPFVLLCYVALGYVWLFRPLGAAIAKVGAGFMVTLLVGLWLDPPHGGILFPEIDRLSIVYATLGVAVFVAGIWLMWLDDRSLSERERTVLGIVGATASFIFWLAFYPSVALGPYAVIPAKYMHVFFGHISETQPVRGFAEGTLLLGPTIFTLMFVSLKVWRARSLAIEAGVWLIVAAGIVLSLFLTARFVIFQQYPAGFAGALLPVALSDVSRRFRAQPQIASWLRIAIVTVILVFPYGPEVAVAATHARHSEHRPSCSLHDIAALMAPAAGKIVLTPVADVPELLYRTRIIGVGSLYQHGIEGYVRAWNAWRASAATGESSAFAATKAQFVLFCPGGAHNPLTHHGHKSSLWSMLNAGNTPTWLRLVAQQKRTGFRLYQIYDAR